MAPRPGNRGATGSSGLQAAHAVGLSVGGNERGEAELTQHGQLGVGRQPLEIGPNRDQLLRGSIGE